MDYQARYREILRTPEEAVKLVKDGDWVDYSQTCSFPQALDRALALLEEGSGIDLAGIDLRDALDCLAAITGDRVDEALMESIFSRFCVGK